MKNEDKYTKNNVNVCIISTLFFDIMSSELFGDADNQIAKLDRTQYDKLIPKVFNKVIELNGHVEILMKLGISTGTAIQMAITLNKLGIAYFEEEERKLLKTFSKN